ncbi:MAG: hypothetical protein ACJ77Z_16610 [Thermoleophilaceae bacterium]
MASPLELIGRLARPARPVPPLGRCLVCQKDIRPGEDWMTIRGDLHVHRGCATYRMRQRSRLH